MIAGRPFFPDASVIGISGSIQYDPNVDLKQALPSFYDKIGGFLKATMAPSNQTSLSQFFIGYHNHMHGFLNEHSRRGTEMLKTIKKANNTNLPLNVGLTFTLELVTTATDLKQALYWSWGITVASNFTHTNNRWAGSISAFAGSVWNIPDIDYYKGDFINVGMQFGAGTISAGVNYFYSIERPSVYGVSTNIAIGTPSDNFSVNATYGVARELWNSNDGSNTYLTPFLLASPFYGPALAIKANQNATQ
jgi:hypothetical protein